MKILIIGVNYEPDLGPSAPLFTMLSKGLVQRGHQATVITMVPNYPSGMVSPEFRGKLLWWSVENGVKVIRIWLPSMDRNHLGKRLFQFLCYQIGATIVSITQKYDVVIAVSSSLSVWLPFYWSVVIRRKPAVYSVHDVYPDVGVQLGIFRNKAIIYAVGNFERSCLKHSNIIRILSDSFRPSLRNLGVIDSKMHLVYDWVDTDLIRPQTKNNHFSQDYGLTERFVVLYAGNIGLSQSLENILFTAQMLENHKDIQFVFVGDGGGKESLQSLSDQLKLTNVKYIPFQPREKLGEVLACSDISLVILRKGIGLASLPSKTYSIMASGRPIIASVDEESETWNLIKKANAGIWVPPENPSKLAESILHLKQESATRAQLGHNGRIWVEQHHSPQYAAEQFEGLLLKALKQS